MRALRAKASAAKEQAVAKATEVTKVATEVTKVAKEVATEKAALVEEARQEAAVRVKQRQERKKAASTKKETEKESKNAASDGKQKSTLPPTVTLQRTILECKTKVQAIVEDCKSKGIKYSDPEFTPDEHMLWADTNEPGDDAYIEHPTHFLRLTELFAKPQPFVDDADPGDVRQGGIGTCFFLGALSVVGTKEHILQDLFVEWDVETGVYGLRLFINGDWRSIIIDDFLPAKFGERTQRFYPIYGENRDPSETWVSLLEKAYAKAYAVYEHIDGGVGRYAMMDLTGGVATRINLEEGGNKTGIPLFGQWKGRETWDATVNRARMFSVKRRGREHPTMLDLPDDEPTPDDYFDVNDAEEDDEEDEIDEEEDNSMRLWTAPKGEYLTRHYDACTLADDTFATVAAVKYVTSGKWYYECVLSGDAPTSYLQLGWATDAFVPEPNNGVGDCSNTYAFDAQRHRLWNGTTVDIETPDWDEGSVVGCLLDLDARTMHFTLTRSSDQKAVVIEKGFDNIPDDVRYYPAASVSTYSGRPFLTFCFAKEHLKHQPPPGFTAFDEAPEPAEDFAEAPALVMHHNPKQGVPLWFNPKRFAEDEYFPTVRATSHVAEGKWYWELELGDNVAEPNLCMQMGWITDGYSASGSNGVGDCMFSWGFDASRKVFWHNGRAGSFECKSWDKGDVVGFMADFDTRKLTFTLKSGGDAATSFEHPSSIPDGVRLYPAITASARYKPILKFIFAKEGFHSSLPEGYTPFSEAPPPQKEPPPALMMWETKRSVPVDCKLSEHTGHLTFPTLASSTYVTSGKWYYEVKVHKGIHSYMQIGWITDTYNPESVSSGVGDCERSFAVDFQRLTKWHGGDIGSFVDPGFEEGDTIGCLVDCDQGFMSFILIKPDNTIKKPCEKLFKDLPFGAGYCPALSISSTREDVHLEFRFDRKDIVALPKGYSPTGEAQKADGDSDHLQVEYYLTFKDGDVRGGGKDIKGVLVEPFQITGNYDRSGHVSLTKKYTANKLVKKVLYTGTYDPEERVIKGEFKWAWRPSKANQLRLRNFRGTFELTIGPNAPSPFDGVWEMVRNKNAEGVIMSLAIEDENAASEEHDHKTGLLKNHAYGVVGVYDLEGEKLVKIRNPHAQGEWIGDWSDKSPKWNGRDTLKKAVGFVDQDDGIFFMTIDDLMKHFSIIDTCRVFTAKWRMVSLQSAFHPRRCGGPKNWSKNPQYKVTLARPTRLVLLMQQPNSKIYTGEDEYPMGIGFRIVNQDKSLPRIFSENVLTLARVDPVCDRQVSLEITLAPMEQPFFVIPICSETGITLPFTFTVYATEDFEFLDVTSDISCSSCAAPISLGFDCLDCYEIALCDACMHTKRFEKGKAVQKAGHKSDHRLQRVVRSPECCICGDTPEGVVAQCTQDKSYILCMQCYANEKETHNPKHSFFQVNCGLTCAGCLQRYFLGPAYQCKVCKETKDEVYLCKSCKEDPEKWVAKADRAHMPSHKNFVEYTLDKPRRCTWYADNAAVSMAMAEDEYDEGENQDGPSLPDEPNPEEVAALREQQEAEMGEYSEEENAYSELLDVSEDDLDDQEVKLQVIDGFQGNCWSCEQQIFQGFGCKCDAETHFFCDDCHGSESYGVNEPSHRYSDIVSRIIRRPFCKSADVTGVVPAYEPMSKARVEIMKTKVPDYKSGYGASLNVGDGCVVLDTEKKWYTSRIIDANDSQVRVHYNGWSTRWDEWLPRDSDRIREWSKIPPMRCADGHLDVAMLECTTCDKEDDGRTVQYCLDGQVAGLHSAHNAAHQMVQVNYGLQCAFCEEYATKGPLHRCKEAQCGGLVLCQACTKSLAEHDAILSGYPQHTQEHSVEEVARDDLDFWFRRQCFVGYSTNDKKFLCHGCQQPSLVGRRCLNCRDHTSYCHGCFKLGSHKSEHETHVFASIYLLGTKCNSCSNSLDTMAMLKDGTFTCWSCFTGLQSARLKVLASGTPVSSIFSSGQHDGFVSVVSIKAVTSGKWYYELVLSQLNGACFQIGYALENYKPASSNDGVGDCNLSWGVDAGRKLLWHNGRNSLECPDWHNGDIVGCLLDLDAKKIDFVLHQRAHKTSHHPDCSLIPIAADEGYALYCNECESCLCEDGGYHCPTREHDYDICTECFGNSKQSASVNSTQISGFTGLPDGKYILGASMSSSCNCQVRFQLTKEQIEFLPDGFVPFSEATESYGASTDALQVNSGLTCAGCGRGFAGDVYSCDEKDCTTGVARTLLCEACAADSVDQRIYDGDHLSSHTTTLRQLDDKVFWREQLFASAASTPLNLDEFCRSCEKSMVAGYKCLECPSFFLCDTCTGDKSYGPDGQNHMEDHARQRTLFRDATCSNCDQRVWNMAITCMDCDSVLCVKCSWLHRQCGDLKQDNIGFTCAGCKLPGFGGVVSTCAECPGLFCDSCCKNGAPVGAHTTAHATTAHPLHDDMPFWRPRLFRGMDQRLASMYDYGSEICHGCEGDLRLGGMCLECPNEDGFLKLCERCLQTGIKKEENVTGDWGKHDSRHSTARIVIQDMMCFTCQTPLNKVSMFVFCTDCDVPYYCFKCHSLSCSGDEPPVMRISEHEHALVMAPARDDCCDLCDAFLDGEIRKCPSRECDFAVCDNCFKQDESGVSTVGAHSSKHKVVQVNGKSCGGCLRRRFTGPAHTCKECIDVAVCDDCTVALPPNFSHATHTKEHALETHGLDDKEYWARNIQPDLSFFEPGERGVCGVECGGCKLPIYLGYQCRLCPVAVCDACKESKSYGSHASEHKESHPLDRLCGPTFCANCEGEIEKVGLHCLKCRPHDDFESDEDDKVTGQEEEECVHDLCYQCYCLEGHSAHKTEQVNWGFSCALCKLQSFAGPLGVCQVCPGTQLCSDCTAVHGEQHSVTIVNLESAAYWRKQFASMKVTGDLNAVQRAYDEWFLEGPRDDFLDFQDIQDATVGTKWEAHRSPGNKVYFYNTDTEVSTWEMPGEVKEKIIEQMGADFFEDDEEDDEEDEDGLQHKVKGRQMKARGRKQKARGRKAKARGRKAKARGRKAKARGRKAKARGRKAKARGRKAKIRNRLFKVRGKSTKDPDAGVAGDTRYMNLTPEEAERRREEEAAKAKAVALKEEQKKKESKKAATPKPKDKKGVDPWEAAKRHPEFSNKQIKKIIKTFDKFDADKSGLIDRKEMVGILKANGEKNVSPERVDKLMKEFDDDGDQLVTFEELLIVLKKVRAGEGSADLQKTTKSAFCIVL